VKTKIEIKYFGFMVFFLYFSSCFLFAQGEKDFSLNVILKEKKINNHTFTRINEGIIRTLIIDKDDEPVLGLNKTNFSIYQKKKKAIIDSVVPLKEVEDTRMRVLLLIDNSFSMSTVKEDVVKILDSLLANLGNGVKIFAALFDRSFSNPNYTFQNKKLPIRMVNFTKDKRLIKEIYKQGFATLSDNTYLYDEIFLGCRVFENDTTKKVDKNFAIVLSDGADIGSNAGQTDILQNLPPGLVFFNIDFMHSESGAGKPNKFLKDLAFKTQGEYFNPKDIQTLSKFLNQIATQIVDKGYQIYYQFPVYKPVITNNLNDQLHKGRNKSFADFPGLAIEEIIIKESFPLLNYVFFNNNSDTLPQRYILFKDLSEPEKFSEKSIIGNALDHYYNVLNIIGSRFKNDTAESITISGFTDGKEKGGLKLAQQRAANVKNYLENIWKIPTEKIKMISKILPEKPSTRSLEEGLAENRRVEIECGSWNVLKPVTFEEHEFRLLPKNIEFSIKNENNEGESVAEIEKWEININRNNKKWMTLSGDQNNSEKIVFDWKDTEGRQPLDSLDYTYQAKIIDNGGDMVTSPDYKIPVLQVRQEKTKIDSSAGKPIEKISLVLFEFNKFELGRRNDLIMNEFVYPRLYDSVYVIVNGYTDIIGQDEANLKLSVNRARAVSEVVSGKVAPDHLFYEGFGKTKPLYDNALPEGRFYNRTVQLFLQDIPPELPAEESETPKK
jgi:outer membrane protein OmpA-like peptidoglycan-associated protein